jgi:membrane-associated phospholipid phosphatase
MGGSPGPLRVTLLVLLLVVSPAGASAQDAARQADRPVSFTELLRDIPGDFKSLPSMETGLWVALGATGGLAVHPADTSITNWLSGNETLGDVFNAGNVVGSPWLQGGAAGLVYGIGLATTNPKLSRIGAELIRSQVLSDTVTLALKVAVQRTRPDGGRFSFPSGHATATSASATVLQQELGWKVGIPAYIVAGYVAIARVQGRHHYPSDVIFGAMVGVASARTVTLRVRRTRLQMAASALPGGVYVGFVVARPR